MLAEPGLRGAVTIFATHPLGDFERPAALLGWRVKRMTGETLRRCFRFARELKNTGHALAKLAGERLIRAGVLVFQNPGGVLVLQDSALRNGFHAAVARGRGARTWPDIFRFRRGPSSALRCGGRSERQAGAKGECKRRDTTGARSHRGKRKGFSHEPVT